MVGSRRPTTAPRKLRRIVLLRQGGDAGRIRILKQGHTSVGRANLVAHRKATSSWPSGSQARRADGSHQIRLLKPLVTLLACASASGQNGAFPRSPERLVACSSQLTPGEELVEFPTGDHLIEGALEREPESDDEEIQIVVCPRDSKDV